MYVIDHGGRMFDADDRPEQERKGTGWSDRYISTVDGPDSGRVAEVFAEDLASLLQRKGIAEYAFPANEGIEPTEKTTLLNITLHSWYGRVTDVGKLTKAEQLSIFMGNTSVGYDNKGECRFSASVKRSGRSMDLGSCYGDHAIFLKDGGTRDDANRLSGAAADRAFVQFLQTFEKEFKSSNR
jgi:hypothetical protein